MKAFGVEAEWAGMAVECPFCETAVQVPDEVQQYAVESPPTFEVTSEESTSDDGESTSEVGETTWPLDAIASAGKPSAPDFGSIVFRDQSAEDEFPGIRIQTEVTSQSPGTEGNETNAAEGKRRTATSLDSSLKKTPAQSGKQRQQTEGQPDKSLGGVEGSGKRGQSNIPAKDPNASSLRRKKQMPPQDERQSRWKLTEGGKVPSTDSSVASEQVNSDLQATRTASVELPVLKSDDLSAKGIQLPASDKVDPSKGSLAKPDGLEVQANGDQVPTNGNAIRATGTTSEATTSEATTSEATTSEATATQATATQATATQATATQATTTQATTTQATTTQATATQATTTQATTTQAAVAGQNQRSDENKRAAVPRTPTTPLKTPPKTSAVKVKREQSETVAKPDQEDSPIVNVSTGSGSKQAVTEKHLSEQRVLEDDVPGDRGLGIQENRVLRPAKLPISYRNSVSISEKHLAATGPLGIVVRSGVTEIEYQGQKVLLRDQPVLKKFYGLLAFIVSVVFLVLVLAWLSYRSS